MLLIDKFDFSILSIPKLKLHLRYLIPLLFGVENFEIQIDNLKLMLRPRTYDLYIVAEIFFENSSSIPQLENKRLNTVVDLGANIGIFTIWAAKNYSPRKVISVEMDKDNVNLLQANIAGNSALLKSDFAVINKAVYSNKTVLSYQKVPINKGMHTLMEDNKGKNSIETITLQELISTTGIDVIDLLKIDIEGSEKYLLNTENEKIFSGKIRFVAMEVHQDKNFKISDVENYFSRIGFECKVLKNWSSINYLVYAENSNL
jgi:FkbM family methyltransferase